MGNVASDSPAAPERHQWLIELMEASRTFGSALAEGLTWGWETLPQNISKLLEKDAAHRRCRYHVPHGAVRAYVMGERGARNEPATASDIAAMARIVEQGLKAGALGFSTSRTMLHKAKGGESCPAPSPRRTSHRIGMGMKRAGQVVFEMAADLASKRKNSKPWRSCRAKAACRSPMRCSGARQSRAWRESIRRTEAANARGGRVTAQIALRGTGLLLNWSGTVHSFMPRPSWHTIAGLAVGAETGEVARTRLQGAASLRAALARGCRRGARRERLFTGWGSHVPHPDDRTTSGPRTPSLPSPHDKGATRPSTL